MAASASANYRLSSGPKRRTVRPSQPLTRMSNTHEILNPPRTQCRRKSLKPRTCSTPVIGQADPQWLSASEAMGLHRTIPYALYVNRSRTTSTAFATNIGLRWPT